MNHTSRVRDAAVFILFIVICEAVGLLGAISTRDQIRDWYAFLRKPAFNPPSWVFGPVWTLLYALMGAAAFLVWKRGLVRRDVKIALGLFVLQLALNGAWSPVFFSAHAIAAALLIIVMLLIAIGLTIWRFAPISRVAGALMIPYLLWVAFATLLNASILVRNS